MIRTMAVTLLALCLSITANAADAPPTKLKLRDPAADRAAAVTEGKTNADPTTGMEFVYVKGGCYQMGSNEGMTDEKPAHEVCVSDFYLGKYEVTQGQWQTIMGNNPSHFKQCGPECPVESVSWDDAQGFIKKLNSRSGRQYRLPTEAEWEYAARSGGKNEKWAGTSDESSLGKYAWYDRNSGKMTHRVGLKKANGLGLYDMSGNVCELCQDWYNEAYYEDSPKNNPPGADIGEKRVLRGGSWFSYVNNARTASRIRDSPDDRYDLNGLRLVLPAQ